VTVTATDDGFRLDLAEPAFAVARGQTAVLYRDERVVGAGTITSAPRN
jgi:tRNA U34 2-thiouridine synthase MnmA/TrmU